MRHNRRGIPKGKRSASLRRTILQRTTRLVGVHSFMLPGWVTARMESVGFDMTQLDPILNSMKGIDSWARTWEEAGDQFQADDDCTSALIAYYVAQKNIFGHAPFERSIYDKYQALYVSSIKIHQSPIRQFEVEHDDGLTRGYVQFPLGQKPRSLLLVVPGLTATKEDFHEFVGELLELGFAIARFDLPGFGQSEGFICPATRYLPGIVAKSLPKLVPEVQGLPVDAVGWCVGGNFAIHSSTIADFRSISTVSAPCEPVQYMRSFDLGSSHALLYQMFDDPKTELAPFFECTSLSNVAKNVVTPVQFIVSGKDHWVPPTDHYQFVAKTTAQVKEVMLPEETHGCPGSSEAMQAIGSWADEYSGMRSLSA